MLFLIASALVSMRMEGLLPSRRTWAACAVAGGLMTAWTPAPAGAQTTVASARTPPGGAADLSGVWQVPYVPDMTRDGRGQRGAGELPFTEWGRAQWEGYDAADGDYTGSCLPYGMTRSFNVPNPFQVLQTDHYVAFLFEANTWFHLVPMGRPHPEALEPTWFGHSVGRWEGDRLVVETRGFNGYTRLDTVGHPHSDALRLTQTFRRVDENTLAYTVTVDDPKTYTKPWTNERTFTRLKGDLIEYSCEENNKALWEGRIKRWVPPAEK